MIKKDTEEKEEEKPYQEILRDILDDGTISDYYIRDLLKDYLQKINFQNSLRTRNMKIIMEKIEVQLKENTNFFSQNHPLFITYNNYIEKLSDIIRAWYDECYINNDFTIKLLKYLSEHEENIKKQLLEQKEIKPNEKKVTTKIEREEEKPKAEEVKKEVYIPHQKEKLIEQSSKLISEYLDAKANFDYKKCSRLKRTIYQLGEPEKMVSIFKKLTGDDLIADG